ncbi:MAG: hypothetical protein KUG73_09505 [Pseudomonadales bacterium]|nr:hypothetical protein [Pseudomonadales bacterium]
MLDLSKKLMSTSVTTIVLFFTIMVSGCGGGSSSSGTGLVSDNSSTAKISGTAATGAPIEGTVSLVDANGVSVMVTILADGSFEIDIEGMEAPFMLQALDTASTAYFSYADGAGTVNITPLTSLAIFMSAGNTDPSVLFSDWGNQLDEIGAAELEANAQIIYANLSSQMADNNVDPQDFDIFSEVFSADGTGIDGVLDVIEVIFGDAGIVITEGSDGVAFDIDIDLSEIDFENGVLDAGDVDGVEAGNWTLVVSVEGIDVTINNVQAPDDVNGVSDAFDELNSADSGISNVEVLTVENTSTRKVFTINYTITAQGLSIPVSATYTYTLN